MSRKADPGLAGRVVIAVKVKPDLAKNLRDAAKSKGLKINDAVTEAIASWVAEK